MSNYVNADAGKGKEKGTDGTGSPHNLNAEKDRVGASFGDPHAVNPAYGRGGSGSKGNPGKPT